MNRCTDEHNHDPNAWDGHSDVMKDDVEDHIDDDADDKKMITNEENEDAWDNFPEISPPRAFIPWKLLRL